MNRLSGAAILDSPILQEKIDTLVAETMRLEQSLRDVRPPLPEFMDRGKRIFEEAGRFRGRALNYPFIGTGAGFGPYVEVEDGSVKLDLINGIGVHILGHGHPRLRAAAVKAGLSDVVMQGNLEPNHDYVTLGRRITDLARKQSRLKYCWFATCGTMANENALKLTRQKHSPARFVVAMEHAFAGRSTMMAEITDNPGYREGLPAYGEVLRLPWYNSKDPRSSEKSLRTLQTHVEQHPGQISCLVFEPMLGEGGYFTAPPSYFLPMLEFCRAQKIAVWVDEVQTFMRTGELFAFEKLGIGDYVDICTIAKTLQTGATLFTEDYNPKPGLIAGTFSGSSSSLAVGLEALNILVDEGYLGPDGHIEKIHRDFVAMLNRLNDTTCAGQLRDAGGLGLMVAVTPLDGSKDKVYRLLQVLYRNGLIAFTCGHDPYRLRFLIPAVMRSRDIQKAGDILEKSIAEML